MFNYTFILRNIVVFLLIGQMIVGDLCYHVTCDHVGVFT